MIEYANIDLEIRRLQTSGKHAQAIALCIGNEKDQSNWAFDQFDLALGRTLKINQDAFDNAVSNGFAAVNNFEWKALIVALIIALLAFFGMMQRIREYR